jgi:nucleoside-diphosphate-sugar epimerase
MRAFLTGVNGYIGALLGPHLSELGIEVRGLDTGYYRDGSLYSDDRSLPTVLLAQTARNVGIRRFVYTSSCSVYGVGSGEFLAETTEPNPQTAYAECKVLVERDVGGMAGKDFSPVFLRNVSCTRSSYGMTSRARLASMAGGIGSK